MKIECKDFYRALHSERPDMISALEEHAARCAECRADLELWRGISEVAPALRRDKSPDLWPRIHQALAEEGTARRVSSWSVQSWVAAIRAAGWRGAVAAAALVLISSATAWVLLRNSSQPRVEAPQPRQLQLLTENALREIETAEESYVRSIDRLATLVQPRIANPTSPLLVNYREKLTVIDAAIAECRIQIERNRFNTHLRRELLSIYKEKQRTLEQLLKEDKNAQPN
jgi:hypothetical protein